MVKPFNVERSNRVLRSGEMHAACHYGNHDGEVNMGNSVNVGRVELVGRRVF